MEMEMEVARPMEDTEVANEVATRREVTGRRKDRVVIVDWDDTLLPSSHLAALGFCDETVAFCVEEAHQAELTRLATEVARFLRACCELGKCYIVTNSDDGWVQRTCQRFLPTVLPLLENVTIVSARPKSECELLRTSSPCQWKIAALSAIVGAIPSDELRQIVAFGDSPDDRAAVRYIASQEPCRFRVKSIKFIDRPTMSQMTRQLELVCGFLPQVCACEEVLDLVLAPNMLA